MNRLLACSPSLASGIVLGFAATLFGLRIDLPLLEPEEARYAEISRQMLVRDRFLVPIRDGQDYLDKPPPALLARDGGGYGEHQGRRERVRPSRVLFSLCA